MSYPGDKACKPRPDCVSGYDILPVYSYCENNKRNAVYELNKNSICNWATFQYMQNITGIPCETCNPGYYVMSGFTRDCVPCKTGMYSISENSDKCETCPAGYYAPKSLHFANLEKFPHEFATLCEKTENATTDPCNLYKGWVVLDGSLAVPPYIPIGSRLILKTMANITENKGKLEFLYNIGLETNEILKLEIDGTYTKLDFANTGKLMSFFLFKGLHRIDWIYEKIGNENVKTLGNIKNIRIAGTNEGYSDSCLKCPMGTISTIFSTKCVECPEGTTSNENNTKCEKLSMGFYRSHTMLSPEKCSDHTHTTEDQTSYFLNF